MHLEERLRMGDEIMKTYIYEGGLRIVAKSGVGSAILHQKNMLKQAEIEEATSWKEADIVHINTVFPDSVIAAGLAKLQGKKVVYYGHSTMEDFRNSFIGSNRVAPLFKKWIRFCYSLGDLVITPTEYSKGLLESYGIQKKIYAVSNGVDTEFFKSENHEEEKKMLCRSASIQVLLPSFIPKAEKYLSYKHFTAIPNAVPEAGVQAHPGEKKEEYVITSVGRLTGRTKRQHLLIEAFALLAEDFPQWKVNFWGADYDRAYVMKLKKLIEGKHLENQVFLKGTTRDMQSVWKETDIFAFPSHHEGFPLALTEAMAAGIPVVGYASCPAVNELIVSGENGYLAEDGVEALAESLKALMLDPAKRESFGRKARQDMEAYRPECVWNSWEMLIKDTVERTKNTKG